MRSNHQKSEPIFKIYHFLLLMLFPFFSPQLYKISPFFLFLFFCYSKVFFTDYGSTPRVERCDMDGQNRTKLVDSKIVFPHGITLDLVNRMVYWADAYLDYIEVVDYEGKNRHTIIQGLLVRFDGWLDGCVQKKTAITKHKEMHSRI